jgi:anti-anti-sigma regulatory factor
VAAVRRDLGGQLRALAATGNPDSADAARLIQELMRREEDLLVAVRVAQSQAARVSQIGTQLDEERRADHERYQATLRLMGLPMLDAGSALLVPIVGGLDEGRARDLSHMLLGAMQGAGPRNIIIDLSAIERCDAATIERLVATADAVRLLGGHVILTGIRPGVAAALVRLGDVRLPCVRTVADALRSVAYKDSSNTTRTTHSPLACKANLVARRRTT